MIDDYQVEELKRAAEALEHAAQYTQEAVGHLENAYGDKHRSINQVPDNEYTIASLNPGAGAEFLDPNTTYEDFLDMDFENSETIEDEESEHVFYPGLINGTFLYELEAEEKTELLKIAPGNHNFDDSLDAPVPGHVEEPHSSEAATVAFNASYKEFLEADLGNNEFDLPPDYTVGRPDSKQSNKWLFW